MVYVLGVLLVAIAVIVAAAMQKPDVFKVTREARFNAAPAIIFEYINDLRKWNAWSPWARMDPDAKYTFDGPAAGVGASTSWEGKRTGAGRMTVMESKPFGHVIFKLEFFKPMKAVNTAAFTFREDAGQTVVTWSMFGPNSFMGKLMSLFMNCEKMVGDQFEQGFENLKAIVDKS